MRTGLPGTLIILIVTLTCAACSSGRYEPFVSEPGVIGPVADDSGRAMFQDDLTPYGEWTWIAGPGWVWSPHVVPAGWRPYTLGRWVYTDYGWTWASDEEFGWAVYHYGRWHNDAARGWVWVPGLEWGPAWVAWQSGGGYVGWAPLPWQVRWRAEVGLDWGEVHVSLDPSWWCFAQTRHLASPTLVRHLAPATRNVTIIRTTTNITNYTYIDNRIVNSSVNIDHVGRAVGHSIPRYRVRHDESPEHRRGGLHAGELVVFRPGSARSHEVRQDQHATPAVRRSSGPHHPEAPGPRRPEAPARVRDERGHQRPETRDNPGGGKDSHPGRGPEVRKETRDQQEEKPRADHPRNDPTPPSRGADRPAPHASPDSPPPGHQPQAGPQSRKDQKPADAPGNRGGGKSKSSKPKPDKAKDETSQDEKSKDDKQDSKSKDDGS